MKVLKFIKAHIGLSLLVIAAWVIALVALHNRAQYCEVACGDMLTCGFRTPDYCELQCLRGTRRIELPTTCPELANRINNVEKYLW